MTLTAETEPPVQRPGRRFVEKFVAVDGVSIRYAQAGAGPDLIILPTSSGLLYNLGVDLLTDDFKVTMIDPPGWGQSPPDQKSKPIPELAHTTAAMIAALGIESYFLSGGSIGSIHALWVTALYPDRVKRLMLDGSMAFRRDHWAMPGSDPVRVVRAAEQGADVSGMIPRPHPRKPWATLEERQKQLKRILRVIEFTGPEFDEDLAARVRTLDVPTLVLYGAKDHIVFPGAATVYESLLKRCTTRIIEEGGHDIPGEAPEIYAETVKKFLTGTL